jgi:hypothetical protein
MKKKTAPGYSVRGTSTLYDENGLTKIQWVKTDRDKEDMLAALKEAVEALIEPCKGIVPLIQGPADFSADLMTVYPVADLHLGMLTWAEECGDDFDTKIAVDLLCKAQNRLVAGAPNSETALIANLGDFFHADTSENRTMRSGAPLDVDGRWAKVLWAGVLAYRDLIQKALQKHDKVIVKSAIGNHDDHSNVALAMAMKLAFESNPRVTIELPIDPFQFHVFGKVLLGMVHTCKPADLEGIMATDMRKEWGDSLFCHWMTAHIHHQTSHEFKGCTAESFRTIASKDAWTHRSGYRSGRSMCSIVYHKDFGEIERSRVGIEAIA